MLGQPLVLLSGLILVGVLVFLIWRAGNDKPATLPVREPLVNIRDEGQTSIVVAELPGVGEDEIRVNVEEGFIVSLETTGERKYAATIPLSESVIAATLQKMFRNGVLELRLQKA